MAFGNPESYHELSYESGVHRIGRSSFRTDRIPETWPGLVEKKVQELWVPSAFHYGSFTNAGVPAAMVQTFPHFIDVNLWSPQVPMRQAAGPSGQWRAGGDTTRHQRLPHASACLSGLKFPDAFIQPQIFVFLVSFPHFFDAKSYGDSHF